MAEDGRSGHRAPQDLFLALSQPQSGSYAARVALRPLREGGLFAGAFIGLAILLTLAQLRGDANAAVIDLLPSEAVFALLVGVALFPLRLIWVPVATYAVAFLATALLRFWLEPGYLPDGSTAFGFLGTALVLNALPALAAGLAGRVAARMAGVRHRRHELFLSLGVLGAYLLLAGAGVPAAVALLYRADWGSTLGQGMELIVPGLLRAARIGLCGAVLLLLLLDRPDRRSVTISLAILPAFLILALLRVDGYAMHPTLDVLFLSLSVALLAPAYAAILGNVVGVIAYVAITGEFLVQIPITSVDILRLEVASVLLLALVYLLLLQRHQMQRERALTRDTIARMERVQELATVGFFLLDLPRGRVQVDGVAATILGTSRSFSLGYFLRRVHPEDRALIEGAIADATLEKQTLSFRLSDGPDWDDRAGVEAAARFVSVHAWFEHRGGITAFAYGALIDMTPDHRREVALAEALARLSEQQNRQTQLFSIVSHELRTPASVIAMLVEELDGGASWTEMGPRMRAVSEQLLSVLADMRQTVRPGENLPVRIETVRPSEIAETVRNTFLLMAESKGVEIGLDLTPSAWMARMTDRVRLVQALSNLVKNAILHSYCGRIVIGYAEVGSVGLWRVADDGLGVPEEARAALFEPFRRGDGLGTARTDGSGLGLYVTKSSIELLGGTVTYVPDPAGGSVFELRLPVIVPEEGEGTTVPAAAAKEPGQRGRILMAEDSELIGELLVARLNRFFEEVVWVKNGADALAAYGVIQPDVVLTDLFMPELGGDDLTSTLRERGADCLIIGMTAAAIGEERTRFEQAGTDLVLTKPVSTRQLMEVLDQLEARARARAS